VFEFSPGASVAWVWVEATVRLRRASLGVSWIPTSASVHCAELASR
jgi:hypothetical protein